ncbi:unnamed protein product [Urochloa decumbens]|uniref:RING-type domain-containing protein n=1 Tax=Urochloa decumbens TaxID=240449 RepID=A0ABC9G828_9POAL
MDWEDFGDWLNWGIGAFGILAGVVFVLMVLVVCVWYEPPLSTEELLERILPAVRYKELPGDAGGGGCDDDDERDSCVICVTPYETGEVCTVLPGCTHMFHKPCVAKWLRQKKNRPLCRATVDAQPRKVVPLHLA